MLFSYGAHIQYSDLSYSMYKTTRYLKDIHDKLGFFVMKHLFYDRTLSDKSL